MGLVGVLATQLWYQQFIDASLADLPSRVRTAAEVQEIAARNGAHAGTHTAAR